MSRGRFICRIALLAIALTAMPQVPSTAHTTTAMQSIASSSGLRPEVRLRKLHLVRPDLIQYPLSFEVYC